MNKRKIYIIFAMSLFSLINSFYIIFDLEKLEKSREKNRGKYLIESQILILENILNSYLYKTDILDMFVITNKGKMDGFDYIGEKLFENDGVIRAIQIAPDGIIKKSYPLKIDIPAKISLFKNPYRKDEAYYAKESKELYLSGPYKLFQGGIGLIGRKPIFLDNENKKFWGFSIIVLNYENLLKKLQISKLNEEGYFYKILKYNPLKKKYEIFAKNSKEELKEPLNVEFYFKGQKWEFFLEPKLGWNKKNHLNERLGMGFFISILVGLITYSFLYINEQRKNMKEISMRDYLTGLYNRRKFEKEIREKILEDNIFTIINCDLNDFKIINDTYGHKIGDIFLIKISNRLKDKLENKGELFRIGGDEFTIIFKDNLEKKENKFFWLELKKYVEKELIIENININPSFSFGYGVYPFHGRTIEELEVHADKEMYKNKLKYKEAKNP